MENYTFFNFRTDGFCEKNPPVPAANRPMTRSVNGNFKSLSSNFAIGMVELIISPLFLVSEENLLHKLQAQSN